MSVLMAFSLVFFVPALFLGVFAVVVIGFIVLMEVVKRGVLKPGTARTITSVVLETLLIAALYLLFFRTGMWLPGEAIEVEDRQQIVGYVLADDDRWTTILIEDGRLIELLPSGEVVSRAVCDAPGQGRLPSAIQLLLSSSVSPPKCADLVAP